MPQRHLHSRHFNGWDKDCKKRRETFKCWDLVQLILEVWRYYKNQMLRSRNALGVYRFTDISVVVCYLSTFIYPHKKVCIKRSLGHRTVTNNVYKVSLDTLNTWKPLKYQSWQLSSNGSRLFYMRRNRVRRKILRYPRAKLRKWYRLVSTRASRRADLVTASRWPDKI